MFTKNFTGITKKDVAIAGGKGASLGEMTKAEIAVPPGYVVAAQAFDKFLLETDTAQAVQAELNKLNYKDTNSIDGASVRIRALISGAHFPSELKDEILAEFKKLKTPLVAVRSSATAEDSSSASWAGELETYLNTDEKNLIENVKKCWSSLFTPRAIFYRHEKKLLKAKVSVAVVIQSMIQSVVSGICFTVHPVTKDRNQMIIEAGWGLGEAIVSGQITPDSYVIDKRDWSIMDINVSSQTEMIIKKGKITKTVPVSKSNQEKQKLQGKKILELAKLCGKIEKHYRFPCDIEWAVDRGKIYITQSRPITTL
jgi:pyruvate, water dikinase